MVFFNHYFFSSLIICLPRGLVSVYTHKGSQVPSHLVLTSRSVLVLSQPSDISDLYSMSHKTVTLMMSLVLLFMGPYYTFTSSVSHQRSVLVMSLAVCPLESNEPIRIFQESPVPPRSCLNDAIGCSSSWL